MRGRNTVSIQVTGDPAEAVAGIVRCRDAHDDTVGQHRSATGGPHRRRSRRRRVSMLREQPLEFVNRHELLTPRQLNRLDQRQDPTGEGRRGHTERGRGLCPRIGEPLDMLGLADSRVSGLKSRRRGLGLRLVREIVEECGQRIRVAPGLRALAMEPTPYHPYTVHKRRS